jgi:hypothetical protein
MRAGLILVGAFTLAVISAAFSLSEAGSRIAPGLAGSAFPLNERALERAASLAYRLEQARAEDPLQPPSPAVVKQAGAALSRGLLVEEAMAIIARAEAARDPGRSLAILTAAHALTRRSTMLNLDLIIAYERKGRIQESLPLLDEILRRQTAAHGPMLEQLAAFAGRKDFEGVLLKLLSGNANWTPQFWRQVAQSPVGLANAADLRLGYARNGGTHSPDIDLLLIGGLAEAGHHADAARVASALFPGSIAGERGLVVRNAEFAREPDVLPFDWTLTNTGDYGASIDLSRGAMLISALGGARGTAASQLVALPNAPLSIMGEVTGPPSKGAYNDLHLALRCAETGETLIRSAIGDLPMRLEKPRCRWARLQFELEVPSESEGSEWLVQRVSIQRSGSAGGAN